MLPSDLWTRDALGNMLPQTMLSCHPCAATDMLLLRNCDLLGAKICSRPHFSTSSFRSLRASFSLKSSNLHCGGSPYDIAACTDILISKQASVKLMRVPSSLIISAPSWLNYSHLSLCQPIYAQPRPFCAHRLT